MNLNLLRAVLARVGNSNESLGIQAQLGDVVVFPTRSVRLQGESVSNLLIASLPVTVSLESDGSIEIPDEPRKLAEATLETAVRLMAIDRQEPHSLSSPLPFLGFASEDPSVLEQLDGVEVKNGVINVRPNARNALGLFDGIDPRLLMDRLDGVALLAEALNSSTALGRYMQLIRLLERAFKVGPSGITAPLAEFLKPSPFDIDLAEVETWTAARALSAHADRREEFYLDADVRPIVDRMQQAGYEVLLNKKDWRNSSSERREVWRPTAGSQGTGPNLFVKHDVGAAISFQFTDGYESYPLVPAGPMDEVLPRAAWLVGDKDSGRLKISGSWEPKAAEATTIKHETG
jgi:hypothetical protein